jgi:hypothetical protein
MKTADFLHTFYDVIYMQFDLLIWLSAVTELDLPYVYQLPCDNPG